MKHKKFYGCLKQKKIELLMESLKGQYESNHIVSWSEFALTI